MRFQNLRTLGELTVVHTRAEYLSLDDINSYELGTNDLWNNLTNLNIMNRQTFKPGNAKRKLQLIHPHPDTYQEEGLGLGQEDTEEVVDDDEALLDRYDEDDTDTGAQTENKNDVITGDKQHRYNLRPRKFTVRLTGLKINKTDLVTGNLKKNSILKQKNYNPWVNFEMTNFKLSDKFHFLANKKALVHHESTCLYVDCMECVFYKIIKKFTFQSNSLLGYQMGYANLQDTKIQKQGKRINFEEGTKREANGTKVVKINWSTIQLANYYCISLKEVPHLKL